MQDHDVVGIGNAIVDIIGRCDDAFLAAHGRVKGSMQLVDAPTVEQLYAAMGPGIEISGGSAANTIAGVASFGGKAGFIGKTATDQFGEVFRHDIRAAGVTFDTPPAGGGEPTGRCLILVTPDGQRTMNTFLGISPQLGSGEVDAELIRSARIVYLEGYLFDRPEAKAAFRQAAEIAAKAGRQVALTLSDAFCVDRHRAEFLDLVRSSVDILFANESRGHLALRDGLLRRGGAARPGRYQAGGAHPLREGQRDPERRQGDRGFPRRRWPRWWIRRARATSMPRASCSASRVGLELETPASWAAWPRPRSSRTWERGRKCNLPISPASPGFWTEGAARAASSQGEEKPKCRKPSAASIRRRWRRRLDIPTSSRSSARRGSSTSRASSASKERHVRRRAG